MSKVREFNKTVQQEVEERLSKREQRRLDRGKEFLDRKDRREAKKEREQELSTLFPEERKEGIARSVPLDCLPEDEALLSPAPDKSLVESVRRYGVIQNVVLRARLERLQDGWADIHLPYEVVCGRRRIKAARAAGLTHVPALIFEDDYGTLEVLAIVENAERSVNRRQELDHLQALVRKGLSEPEIARVTGMYVGAVKKRLKLLGLSHVLMARWEKGEIADSVAEQAAMLPMSEQVRLELLPRVTAEFVRTCRTAEVQAVLPDMAELFEGLPESPSVLTGRAYRLTGLLCQARALVRPHDPPALGECIDAALALVPALTDEGDASGAAGTRGAEGLPDAE